MDIASWHAAAFSEHSAEPTQTPSLGTLRANIVASQIDVRDGPVFLQRLGQGLEAAADQGWRRDFRVLPSNPDHSNPENTWHWSETCVNFSDTKCGTQSRNRQLLTASTCLTNLLEQGWLIGFRPIADHVELWLDCLSTTLQHVFDSVTVLHFPRGISGFSGSL